jgi:hypothetical protein
VKGGCAPPLLCTLIPPFPPPPPTIWLWCSCAGGDASCDGLHPLRSSRKVGQLLSLRFVYARRGVGRKGGGGFLSISPYPCLSFPVPTLPMSVKTHERSRAARHVISLSFSFFSIHLWFGPVSYHVMSFTLRSSTLYNKGTLPLTLFLFFVCVSSACVCVQRSQRNPGADTTLISLYCFHLFFLSLSSKKLAVTRRQASCSLFSPYFCGAASFLLFCFRAVSARECDAPHKGVAGACAERAARESCGTDTGFEDGERERGNAALSRLMSLLGISVYPPFPLP